MNHAGSVDDEVLEGWPLGAHDFQVLDAFEDELVEGLPAVG